MIGDAAFHARERRIVDNCSLVAAPGIDVAVDRVEAGVANAADKPAAVDAGVGIEHGLGLFEPVDVGRRVTPKALRVALRAGVDLTIEALTGGPRGVHGVVPPPPILDRPAAFASTAAKPPCNTTLA